MRNLWCLIFVEISAQQLILYIHPL